MSPESSALLQLSNQREKTVRVYSDGVPERDYPVGCQLAVPYAKKDNYLSQENKEAEASTSSQPSPLVRHPTTTFWARPSGEAKPR
jgi:hypothetical protein